METFLQVLISEGYHKRGLTLARIADLSSRNTARIMGLAPRKGAIAIGADADFSIVDLDGRTRIDPDRVVSGAGFSIYDGWEFKGRVVHTVVRGRAVLRDGQADPGAPGHGGFLRRRLAAA